MKSIFEWLQTTAPFTIHSLVAKHFQPGYRFKEGRLLIFSEAEVFILDPWPKLEAVKKKAKQKEWEKFLPLFRLLRPTNGFHASPTANSHSPLPIVGVDPTFERESAFRSFRASIPADVTKGAECFPARQWRILRACLKSKRFQELLRVNPALAFSLVHFNFFPKTRLHTFPDALEKVACKQREICGLLGFEATDACAKILAHIQPEAVRVKTLLEFQTDLRAPDHVKKLSHLAKANSGVLALLDPILWDWTTPKLLEEIANSPEELDRAVSAPMIRDLALMWGAVNPERPHPRVETLRRLGELHSDLTAEFQRRQSATPNRTFPLPPIPGIPGIVPLVNEGDLVEEGKKQHNCAARYGDWVMSGEGYLYKVTKPERATLSIEKTQEGTWEIQQLKSGCNQAVTDDTSHFVSRWLASFQVGA